MLTECDIKVNRAGHLLVHYAFNERPEQLYLNDEDYAQQTDEEVKERVFVALGCEDEDTSIARLHRE